MTRAEVALLVAAVSAAFTFGGLVWQVLLYRLSGPRLVVRLVPAVIDMMNTIVRGPENGFDPEWPVEMTQVLTGWTVDLAEVHLTNVGRTAVSVSEIGLEVGRYPRWSRARHTVRAFPVAIQGASTDNAIRLDSGESATVLFDLWVVVDEMRRRGRNRVTVRASARGAGRRPRRSPWRRRWVFHPGQHSFRGGEVATPTLRAYRALWRSLATEPSGLEKVSLVWGLIRPSLSDDATPNDIASQLETILQPPQVQRAHEVFEAFRLEGMHYSCRVRMGHHKLPPHREGRE
jgi:hypothetical protein